MWSAEDPEIALLLRRACELALANVERREGGPFAALVVDSKAESPMIVGTGANRVITTYDPSDHAEMMAIRDAAARLGRSDLSGLTLVSSCECCPMCLSAALGGGVGAIYFAATRRDAAQAGFSDEAQYRLMAEGGIERQAESVEALPGILEGHDAAVILRPGPGQQVFFGDRVAESIDPTALPIVAAVRAACRATRAFHLPEDTVILSRAKPHPLSLMVADWARIGRIRDALHPDDPARDAAMKDTGKIRYFSDEWEPMPILDAEGNHRVIDPGEIWRRIVAPEEISLQAKGLDSIRRKPFEAWRRMVESGEVARY